MEIGSKCYQKKNGKYLRLKKITKSLWSGALKITLLLLLFFLPAKKSQTKTQGLLVENLIEKTNTIKNLQVENDSLQKILDLYAKNLHFRDSTVHPDVHPSFAVALKEWKGPLLVATSMRRFYNRKVKHRSNAASHHLKGFAVDVRLNKEAADYLKSEEGMAWLQKYHIRYLIEFTANNQAYRSYKEDYGYVRINRKATAPHIHLEMKLPI